MTWLPKSKIPEWASTGTEAVRRMDSAAACAMLGLPLEDEVDRDPAPGTSFAQSRTGERAAVASIGEQIRAVVTSPSFWEIADEFPNNDLTICRRGRPLDFPDWFLFLCVIVSGLAGISTLRNATAYFADRHTWTAFIELVDAYVPDHMTKLGEISRHTRRRHEIANRPRATAARPSGSAEVIQLHKPSNRASRRQAQLPTPPSTNHAYYWSMRWRGLKKTADGRFEPLVEGDPYYGVRQRVMLRFRELAVLQAMQMGLLGVDSRHSFHNPDPAAFIGVDGTVFPMPKRKKKDACSEPHSVGGQTKPRWGSKFTIFSARIPGQRYSRVILDFAHTGHAPGSAYSSESEATLAIAPAIRALSGDSVQGILVDSAIRGRDVVTLERGHLTVVNWPHAASNPDGGPGKRNGRGRVEKSHLRTVLTHGEKAHHLCAHRIYAVGGVLAELTTDAAGDPVLIKKARLSVKRRKNRDGTRREYHEIEITCPLAGDFSALIPLFHTDPTSSDPEANWGEVVRTYPPGSKEFTLLYGQRNDTEARHADIKSRIKHLPCNAAVWFPPDRGGLAATRRPGRTSLWSARS